MEVNKLRIEALHNIMEDLGIKLPDDKVSKIAEDFYHHIEMERELSMTPYIHEGEKSCAKCQAKKLEIADLNKQIEAYQQSVRNRRGLSNHSYVGINQSGQVEYEAR